MAAVTGQKIQLFRVVMVVAKKRGIAADFYISSGHWRPEPIVWQTNKEEFTELKAAAL